MPLKESAGEHGDPLGLSVYLSADLDNGEWDLPTGCQVENTR